MEDLKKRIEIADGLLDRVTVSGDSVFYLASARQELKAIYDLLKEVNEQDGR